MEESSFCSGCYNRVVPEEKGVVSVHFHPGCFRGEDPVPFVFLSLFAPSNYSRLSYLEKPVIIM